MHVVAVGRSRAIVCWHHRNPHGPTELNQEKGTYCQLLHYGAGSIGFLKSQDMPLLLTNGTPLGVAMATMHGNDDGSKFVPGQYNNEPGSKDLAKAITCFVHYKDRLTSDKDGTTVAYKDRYFVHCMTIIVETEHYSHGLSTFGKIEFEEEKELRWQVMKDDGVTPSPPSKLKMTSFQTREVAAYDTSTGSHHLNNANKAMLCYTVDGVVKCMVIVRDVITKKLSRESEFSLGPEGVAAGSYAITNQCEDADCKRDRLAIAYYDNKDTREIVGGKETVMVKMFAPIDYPGDDPSRAVVAKVSAKYLEWVRPKSAAPAFTTHGYVQMAPDDLLIRCTTNQGQDALANADQKHQCHVLHREWNNVWRASAGASFTSEVVAYDSLVLVGNPTGLLVSQKYDPPGFPCGPDLSQFCQGWDKVGWAILCWKGARGAGDHTFNGHGRCRLITPRSLEGNTEKFRNSGVCDMPTPYICSDKSNMPPRGIYLSEQERYSFKKLETFSFIDVDDTQSMLNSKPAIAILEPNKNSQDVTWQTGYISPNAAVICWINVGRKGVCGMLMIDRDNNKPRLKRSTHWDENGGANGVNMVSSAGVFMFETLASAGRHSLGYDSTGSFGVGIFPGIAPTASENANNILGNFGFVCWIKDENNNVFCKLLRQGVNPTRIQGGPTLVAVTATKIANFGLSVVGIDEKRGVLCYLVSEGVVVKFETACLILTIDGDDGADTLRAGPELKIQSRAGMMHEGVLSFVNGNSSAVDQNLDKIGVARVPAVTASSQLLFCGKVKTWGSRGVCVTIVISDIVSDSSGVADKLISMGNSAAFTSTKVNVVSSIAPISATVANSLKPEAMVCWIDEDIGQRKCLGAACSAGYNAALCRSLSSLPQSEFPADAMSTFDGYRVESSIDNGVTWVTATSSVVGGGGAANAAMTDMSTSSMKVGGVAVGKSYLMRVVAMGGTEESVSTATNTAVEVCLLLNSSSHGGACVAKCTAGHALPDVAEDAEGAWQCVATPAGTFQPKETAERGPLGWTICGAGTWSGIGSNKCSDCPQNTYLADEGAVDATAHDALEDCLPCAQGRFSTAASSTCVDYCEPGSFLASTTGCEDCPVGRSQHEVGQRSCKACPSGTFAGVKKSITCEFCAGGQVSANNSESSSCVPDPIVLALATERDALLVDKTNLTTERDGLTNQRDALLLDKTSLTTERDELVADKNGLVAERDGCVVDKNALLGGKVVLETERDTLVSEKITLSNERDVLLTDKMTLLKEKAEFETERDGLLTNKTQLTTERDALVAENMALAEKNVLLKGLLTVATNKVNELETAAAATATSTATTTTTEVTPTDNNDDAATSISHAPTPVPTRVPTPAPVPVPVPAPALPSILSTSKAVTKLEQRNKELEGTVARRGEMLMVLSGLLFSCLAVLTIFGCRCLTRRKKPPAVPQQTPPSAPPKDVGKFGQFMDRHHNAIKKLGHHDHAVSVQKLSRVHSRRKVEKIQKNQFHAKGRLMARLKQRAEASHAAIEAEKVAGTGGNSTGSPTLILPVSKKEQKKMEKKLEKEKRKEKRKKEKKAQKRASKVAAAKAENSNTSLKKGSVEEDVVVVRVEPMAPKRSVTEI